MKRSTIWAIVGLMSAALLGIIFLQSYWINNAIELKRQQFDEDVKIALNLVAKKIEELDKEERNQMIDLTTSKKVELAPASSFKTSTLDIEGISNDIPANTRAYQNYRRSKAWMPKKLDERISPIMLEQILDEELKSRNIYTDYEHRVYARFKGLQRQLIISNGSFAISGEEVDQVTEVSNVDLSLNHTEYKVALFEDDSASPGELVVTFPKKSSVIWGTVLLPLLAAIFFTAIILICFTYTIQVIFAQKKLSEMKTDFVNNMTHEFKTPIATISLAVDSIISPMILGKTDKVKRFAGIIKQENKRMLAQVEKVLQMALLDKKDFELKLNYVDLHEIIRQAVTNSHLQAEARGGTVTARLEATRSKIEGDQTHISNIIYNLLDNANKYTPEKPTIVVSTRNVPNGVEVTIKDNGVGLSKEARKHIFDKFYRVHTGDVHDVKGFGLGLSYVKAMMTAHKGQVDVKSELGKGSSFILTFPFRAR